MKHEKSQPHDTTNTGPGKERFKPSGGENKGGQAARQDGVNHKDKVNAADHAWKYEHSVSKGPIKG